MSHVKLLDCTLRDGAYLLDKRFGDENIRGIVSGLLEAKMDFIEIGFFQNEGFGEGKTVFRNSTDAARYVPDEKGDSLFTVLADCSRYDLRDLDGRRPDSVDAVRECFFKAEKEQAIKNCYGIKEKGYMVFVQPVDIMGYSDRELLELVEEVNQLEPYCISIVDTFGSMYQEDLYRLFELLNHNLDPAIRIGFHSHNNMQMSNALSQEFIRLTSGKREAVVDATLSGMGRGAGNTPTELIAQYMVSKLHAGYDMDALLDVLDSYMENIRSRCSWGYNTSYFVAGCYSAHVNNIAFLKEKNSIRSKDIRYILNKVGALPRKRYDYNLLEKTYMEYLHSDMDDTESLEKLGAAISGKPVLILAPGSTLKTEEDRIRAFIRQEKPVIIGINVIPDKFRIDYLYISNRKRYQYWSKMPGFKDVRKIITSNIEDEAVENALRISFTKFVKCGWEHMDNSTIMVLRLLDALRPSKIYIAGFDGYDPNHQKNYYSENMELYTPQVNAVELNIELEDMLEDYMMNRKEKDIPVKFVTPSRFERQIRGGIGHKVISGKLALKQEFYCEGFLGVSGKEAA